MSEHAGVEPTPGGRAPIAYVLLWFPKASETFVFSEVASLLESGWPLTVYSLYGKLLKNLSPEMAAAAAKTRTMGVRIAWRLPLDYAYWLAKRPAVAAPLLARILLRRWSDWEQLGENVWAFFAGFRLARLLERSGVRHIHAPWANGPATAAWVASLLTGIPFSFAARAGDIYPPDGALEQKIRAAEFVRSDNRVNIGYLARFAGDHAGKLRSIYNGLPLRDFGEAAVRMESPFQLLAVGRFVRIKGFDVLLRAGAHLRDAGLDFRITLVGDGPQRWRLKREVARLGLEDRVAFPGFAAHDRVSRFFREADLFVMPSITLADGDQDGLPTVILEALAHRVPVVATDVCAIHEVVVPGRTGWLVPPGDPIALAGAIREAISERRRALALAGHGRDLVRQNFDPVVNHRELSAWFEETISRGRAGPVHRRPGRFSAGRENH